MKAPVLPAPIFVPVTRSAPRLAPDNMDLVSSGSQDTFDWQCGRLSYVLLLDDEDMPIPFLHPTRRARLPSSPVELSDDPDLHEAIRLSLLDDGIELVHRNAGHREVSQARKRPAEEPPAGERALSRFKGDPETLMREDRIRRRDYDLRTPAVNEGQLMQRFMDFKSPPYRCNLIFTFGPLTSDSEIEDPPQLAVSLRPYQRQAVAWMIDREKIGWRCSRLSTEHPYPLVHGGLLCEEMVHSLLHSPQLTSIGSRQNVRDPRPHFTYPKAWTRTYFDCVRRPLRLLLLLLLLLSFLFVI